MEWNGCSTNSRCQTRSSPAGAARPIAIIAVSPLLTTVRCFGADSTPRPVNRDKLTEPGKSRLLALAVL
jgi:hypothetical protein